MQEFLFWLWYVARCISIALIFIYMVSGIDDVIVDLLFYLRLIYRTIFKRGLVKSLSREHLESVPEKPLAIMVPAWDESNVIRRMLLNTAGAVNYRDFHVFVGTYPNDPRTAEEANNARDVFPNIHVVVTPSDGPTSKADCLNWIYQGIKLHEKQNNMQFAAYIMQDAEDIIHPLWLKFVNYLIPRVDFVQLPVFPLDTPWKDLVSGCYVDDFAEFHTKDIRVREMLCNSLPSAGVGTALSRKTMEFLAAQSNNEVFDVGSLVEDYFMGLKLEKMDGRKIFLQQSIESHERSKSRLTGREIMKRHLQPVAIREYFPNLFWAAVHQRARWVLGISLQGWKMGWSKHIGTNFFLYRDRKGIVTSMVTVPGYLFALIWSGTWIANRFTDGAVPLLISPDEWYIKLVIVVTAFWVWRMVNRAIFTGRLYGVVHGVLAIPRIFVANFVNFFAAYEAIRRFIYAKMTGKPLKWGKTAHVYPSEEMLQRYNRRLGDLLIERSLIKPQQLDAALAEQSRSGKRLGDVLVEQGVLEEEQVVETIAQQKNRQFLELDLNDVLATPTRLSREDMVSQRVLPVSIQDGVLLLASDRDDIMSERNAISEMAGCPVEFGLTTAHDMNFVLERLQGLDAHAKPVDAGNRLGARLLATGVVSDLQLRAALRIQKRTAERIGDIIVQEGFASRDAVEGVLGNGGGQG